MLKQTIPLVDLRGKSLVDLLRAYPDKAHELISASKRMYGIWSSIASLFALPYADKQSHNWLIKTANPYLHEIETFADILKQKGVTALNLAYEWGCTSGAYAKNDKVQLLRILDWPFPALGKNIVVAWMDSLAGDYYNVTWPGIAGVYNALAPERFSVAINQAPMRKHGFGFVGDWLKNRLIVKREIGIPPAHLLRYVCEHAKTYQEAKEMLCRTPLCMPVIYTLAGTKPGEGCIIERLENAAEVKDIMAAQRVSTSNHFQSALNDFGKGWRPRAVDSAGRARQAETLSAYDMEGADFSWLRLPMVNEYTRLIMQSDAATGMLKVQGYEGNTQVTECFLLAGKKAGDDFEEAI